MLINCFVVFLLAAIFALVAERKAAAFALAAGSAANLLRHFGQIDGDGESFHVSIIASFGKQSTTKKGEVFFLSPLLHQLFI